MFINRKNPHGGDTYGTNIEMDFSANLNPFGTPAPVKEALLNVAANCEAYPDPYCRKLKEQISLFEGVPAEDIICGNGSAELIYAFAACLPKDKPALIPVPSFSEYAEALIPAGIDAEYYYTKEADAFSLDAAFADTDFGKYGALFLCSPGNPSGAVIEPELIKKIADSGIRMMLDLTFLDLTLEPELYGIPQLVKEYPNIVVLRSFTKNFAAAGVRLGYALCSDASFLEAMSEKSQCWNVSTFAQEAGCAALGQKEWLKECAAGIAAERQKMTESLIDCGIKVYPGAANFLLIRSETDLYKPLLERGIMIRDCSNYPGLSEGYFRLAVRTPEENARLMSVIAEVTK